MDKILTDFCDDLFKQLKTEYEEKYQEQMDMMSFWTECMCYINACVEDEMGE